MQLLACLTLRGLVLVSAMVVTVASAQHSVPEAGSRAYLERGNAYLHDGQYHKAIAEWEKGLQRDPSNSLLHSMIAITQAQMREERKRQIDRGMHYFFSHPGKACQAWLRVLEITPDDDDAQANVRFLKQESRKHLAALLPAVEEHLRRKEFVQARDLAVKARELACDTDDGSVFIERIKHAYIADLQEKLCLAQRYYQANQYAKAIILLEDLTEEELLPVADLAQTYMFLGYAYEALRKNDKAVWCFRNALRFNPSIDIQQDIPAQFQGIFSSTR
jgi:Tfp pilus assembly protein PilF